MREYVIRRLLLIIPGAIVLTLLVFSMIRIIPGDAADVIVSQQTGGRGGYVPPGLKEKIRRDLGLDKPVYTQYFIWMSHLMRGDLGRSVHSNIKVTDDIKRRFAVTLELVLITMAMTTVIGLSIGVFSAVYQDSWMDYLLRSVSIVGLAVPFFWTAVLLLLYGSLWFNWSPPLGVNSFFEDPRANLHQFAIPAAILAVALGSAVARMTRATVLEVLRQDYIRTARAKGLVEATVLGRHVLKNAMIPVVGLLGIEFAFALSGSVVIEQIWALPGMGQFMLLAIKQRDYPVIQGVILFTGVMVMLINILVDLAYAWLNPRIRYS